MASREPATHRRSPAAWARAERGVPSARKTPGPLAQLATGMALHCTECGFVNAEGANYCQRCGALLPRAESAGEPATATYRIDETGELVPVELDEVTARGPALVIRAGGGRVGESFAVDRERTTIGRRPDSAVFLDDVTVSRDRAMLIRRGEEWYLDDCGSLNGTYVNRSRIESQRLQEADEVQIGKYKLTFHVR
jgi:FHA domain